MTWRHWTNREMEQLRDFIGGGGSYADVAVMLERSRASVKMRCREMGIAMSKDALQAQRSAKVSQRWQDPVYRERQQAGCKRGWKGADERRRIVSEAVKNARAMERCQEATRDRRSEITSKANATRYAGKLDWCPPAYREERHRLIYSRHVRAADADAIIREKIAADTRRASIAEAEANGWSMAFQEQLERVRAGADLVVRRPMVRADHDYSLIGSQLA